MKIQSSGVNPQQTFQTESPETVGGVKGGKLQQQASTETAKADSSGPSSSSASTSKKAELGMAGQAQEAALRSQTNKQGGVRWEMDKSGGLYPRLEHGSQGREVLGLQKWLNEYRAGKGLPPIKEDGVFGKKTKEAVKQYQKDVTERGTKSEGEDDRALYHDGIVGTETWKSMGALPRFQYGCKGENVLELQQRLNEYRKTKGLPPIKEDGKFGQETEKAVRQFQKHHQKEDGLKVDGIAGPETFNALKRDIESIDDGDESSKQVEGDTYDHQPAPMIMRAPEESTELGGLTYGDVKDVLGSVKKDFDKVAEYTDPSRLAQKLGKKAAEEVRPLVEEAKKAVEEADPFRPLGVDSGLSHKGES